MNIPSIKFRLFEKMKLWHDYLSDESAFEKTKKSYWEYEKMILLWAYSEHHQHLYSSIPNRRIFEAFGFIMNDDKKLKRRHNDPREIEGLLKKFHKKTSNNKAKKKRWKELIDKLSGTSGENINYVMGNLAVKEFFKVTEKGRVEVRAVDKDGGIIKVTEESDAKASPARIRITAKGLLLSELLYENYISDNFLKRDFRIYKEIYSLYKMLIGISLVSFLFLFFKQLYKFLEICFNYFLS